MSRTSKYAELRKSPPVLDIKKDSKEVIFTTISVMCDNRHTIRFRKNDNSEFKMSGMGFSLSNWQFKHEVYEMEWEADLGNWDKVISMINTSTEAIQKVASR